MLRINRVPLACAGQATQERRRPAATGILNGTALNFLPVVLSMLFPFSRRRAARERLVPSHAGVELLRPRFIAEGPVLLDGAHDRRLLGSGLGLGDPPDPVPAAPG